MGPAASAWAVEGSVVHCSWQDSFTAPHALHMPRAGGAQRDAAQVAAKRGRRDDRLWAAGSPAMVRAVAAVMREVQQEGGGPGEAASASGDVGQPQ